LNINRFSNIHTISNFFTLILNGQKIFYTKMVIFINLHKSNSIYTADMTEALSSDLITVIVDTIDNGVCRTSTAGFIWAEGQPTETYTVYVDGSLSIDFDAHLPVRPSQMRWLSHVVGGELVQPALADKLLPNLALGMFATSVSLSPSLRLDLAHVQAENYKSPLLLRQVCRAMIHRAQTPGDSTSIE
jgi:hypothetical protein